MRKVKHPAVEALGIRYPTSITVNACSVALSRSSRFDVGRSLSFARARPAVPYCTCEDDQPEDHDDDDHDAASSGTADISSEIESRERHPKASCTLHLTSRPENKLQQLQAV